MNNLYLLSIPEGNWNKDYRAEIMPTADEAWNKLTIDDEDVEGEYVFRNVNGQAAYQLVFQNDTSTITAQLSFTFLPIVQLNGDFGYEYAGADVVMQMPGAATQAMKAKIRWRGGTTNGPGKNKRNYKVKFVDANGNKKDYKFFGLRNDNNWILDAGQVDLFRMRNRIATDLWNDFVTKPYYSKKESKALTGSRGKMVEVFLNDRYQGIFNMCEPIDRKQMKLKKFEENGTIHGGLWKASGYHYAMFWDDPTEPYDNTKDTWDVFELKYPEIDDLSPSDYSTLYDAIKFAATADKTEFTEHVSEYFDVPVMIDYLLFVDVLNAFDVCGKNVYWAVYDKQKDKKLTVGMWDLDCTVGQDFTNETVHPDHTAYDAEPLLVNKVIYQLFKNNVDGFADKAIARYRELRKTYFSSESLISRYQSYYNLITNSGAAMRETARWSGDSDLMGHKLDFDAELTFIKTWINKRLSFLDNYFTSLGIDNITEVVKHDSNIYNTMGQKVDDTYKGIIIKNGKKYLRK